MRSISSLIGLAMFAAVSAASAEDIPIYAVDEHC